MTLNYYELIEPWEPELTGIKDGSSQAFVFEKGFKNKHFYQEFMRVFANPTQFNTEEAMKTEFDLECVKLKKSAILTDFVSFAPMSYWLVSSRVYNILTKYSLGNHRFFTAEVEDKRVNRIDGYYFFYKEIFDWDVIDFSKCEFTKGNDYDGYKEVPINSKEEFLKDRFVKVKKVAVKNLERTADILKVKLPVGILISTPIYLELAAANVTGIKFNKIVLEVTDI